MPETEKDKLLLRLIAKDDLLVERLQHQLLEDASDTRERQQNIEEAIKKTSSYKYHDTPGWLMMSMRDISGMISRYQKVTNDKVGEVKLTVLLLAQVFRGQAKLLKEQEYRAGKFAEYVGKKADFVVKKLPKIHPDYYIELEEDVNFMLGFLYAYSPCRDIREELKIPKKWNP